MNSNGVAFATWNSFDGSYYKIYVSKYSNSSWSAPEEISSGNSLRNNVQIAMNDVGKAVIVYNQTISGSTSSVYVSNYDGTNWSAPAALSSASEEEVHPQVTMNGSGNAIAVWNYKTGITYKIQSKSYDGSDWSETATDISSDYNVKSNVQIDMNDDGDAALVFEDEDTTFYVYESIYNGSSWSTPSALSSSSTSHVYPQVKMNSSGNAISVWNFAVGITSEIQSKSYNGSIWSDVTEIYSGNYVNNVQMDMNDSGNAIIVFNYYPASQVYESRYNGSSSGLPH